MSIQAEKIAAQRMASRHMPTQPFHRHLIGAVELETLFIADHEGQSARECLASIGEIMFGDSAEVIPDSVIVEAIRNLKAKTQ